MENPISDAFRSRLDSPVIGTYTFYFILWNWKILTTLFSELPYKLKIEEIEFLLKHSTLAGIVEPLLMTGVTIVFTSLAKTGLGIVTARISAQGDIDSDKIGRNRELLDKNGADKIKKVLSTKDTALSISNMVQEIKNDTDLFLNRNINTLNADTKTQFESIKNGLNEITLQASGIRSNISDFQTEVNGIVRLKKSK